MANYTVTIVEEDYTVEIAEGAKSLAGLADVALAAPADGEGVFYNAATGKWENGEGAIPAANAAWLTAEKAGVEGAVAGNLLQSDGDNSEDSGIAASDVALTADVLPVAADLIYHTEAYTLAAEDSGGVVRCDGTFTVTLPDGMVVGFQAMVANVGAGVITLAAETTLTGIGTQLMSQWSACYVVHIGSGVWEVYGGAE